MKKLILLILAVFTIQISHASHIASVEISYEHVTLNDYIVHLKIYRDCNGVGLGTTAFVQINSAINNNTFSATLNQTSTSQLYTCFGGTCANPNPFLGPIFQVAEYSGTVTLPYAATDWRFSYSSCCRAPNQTGPTASAGGYAMLDNSTVPFNNSTRTPYNIYTYYFVNQAHTINFGAMETDGDSLDHRLTTALNGVNPSTNYNAPLTPLNPITTTPATPAAFTMNAQTGLLSFTPTSIGTYIVAIETREYRNGVQIASSIRDYQISIISATSPNAFPDLSGINNTTATTTSVAACANASMNFTINSSDPDPTDSTEIILISKPAGSNFVSNTAQNQVGTFSWAVTQADVQAQPHYLVLEVRDNNCGVRHEVIELYVNNCNTDSVWAGDTDVDFTCDNYDVLNIGIANGSTGNVRAGATTNWQAEWCLNWANSFVSSMNYKHADCNGDGTVNAADLAAISANYGLVHNKTNQVGVYKTLGLPDLYCDVNNVQANKGSTVSIPIMLGTTGSLMNDFYGISATVELLNAQTSAPIAVSKNFSWIGNTINSFDFEKNLATNKSAFTFVRNDQQNLTAQQGQIGEISFPIDMTSVTGSKVIVQFSDIKMIKNSGEEITDYNVLADTIEILAPNSVNEFDQKNLIQVYPNPTLGKTTIGINTTVPQDYSIGLYDLVGRAVNKDVFNGKLKAGEHGIDMDMTGMAKGQYLLEIVTELGKKMIPVQKW